MIRLICDLGRVFNHVVILVQINLDLVEIKNAFICCVIPIYSCDLVVMAEFLSLPCFWSCDILS